MKNHIIITLLLLSSLSYTACDPCTKKVNCPAFSGDFLFTWFPYAGNQQTFYFSDGTDRDTLLIDKITQTEPHRFETSTGYNNKERFCEIKGSILSKTSADHPGWINLNVTHYISDEDEFGSEYVLFYFNNFKVNLRLDGNDPSDAYDRYGTADYTITKFVQVELNGTNYSDVFLITTTDTATAAKQQIDKMYFAKNKGIIGYRTYPDQKQFWLQ